jgi:endonuclease-3
MKKKLCAQKIIKILHTKTKNYNPTLIKTIIKDYGKNPFLILICCLLSLRSKDIVTIHICHDLLKKAKTPQDFLTIKRNELEKIIFKIGFYRNKAKVIHEVSRTLLDKYNGIVPRTLSNLLKLPGVGRKTANLVLGMAYNIPAICVDIHVHRISNRLGLVKTKTPEETEEALKKIIPQTHWIEWNNLIVKWGQNVCTPISPKCNMCAIFNLCNKIIR